MTHDDRAELFARMRETLREPAPGSRAHLEVIAHRADSRVTFVHISEGNGPHVARVYVGGELDADARDRIDDALRHNGPVGILYVVRLARRCTITASRDLPVAPQRLEHALQIDKVIDAIARHERTWALRTFGYRAPGLAGIEVGLDDDGELFGARPADPTGAHDEVFKACGWTRWSDRIGAMWEPPGD